MQCLVNLLTKESEQGMVDTFACIEGLYNQYPDEPRIISRYAMGLYNYQKKTRSNGYIEIYKMYGEFV